MANGNITRRTALLGLGAALGGVGVARYGRRAPSIAGTRRIPTDAVQGTLNDASGLSRTPIHKHLILNEPPDVSLVTRLRTEIAEARSAGRPVNVGAARHSMGGQAIPRDGHAITFDNDQVELDSDAGIMRVHAGARWSGVIKALDSQGWGPKVMQSNNDFGVAATFCVNAHGWPAPLGPMGSTVRAFQMVLPDGTLADVKRGDPLFNLTMGGYGLTGALVSMDVEVARNQLLRPTYEVMPGIEFADAFTAALDSGQVPMAYGRMNVDRDNFMQEALLITYRDEPTDEPLPTAEAFGAASNIARILYRAQRHNERAKRLRWFVETDVGPRALSGPATRNSLINEPVVNLDDRDPTRTDILHEYFVEPARFPEFLNVCQDVIPASFQEFLNVTLRFVDTDPQSVLAYAPTPRIAAVMSFSQDLSQRAEADMLRMTRELIDGIAGIGGSYYLPYRPHARLDQLTTAYPRASEFAAAKRSVDPDLVFRNALWDNYLGLL